MAKATAEEDTWASLIVPPGVAYLSGYLPEGQRWEADDMAVIYFSKDEIKKCCIEKNSTQSNLSLSDADMRKHIKEVRSAIIAELKR